MAAASDPYRYVEKRKPIPDPQVLLLPPPFTLFVISISKNISSLFYFG